MWAEVNPFGSPSGIITSGAGLSFILAGVGVYWRGMRESRRLTDADRASAERAKEAAMKAQRAAEKDRDEWRSLYLSTHAEVMRAMGASFDPASVARLMSRLTHPSALAPVRADDDWRADAHPD